MRTSLNNRTYAVSPQRHGEHRETIGKLGESPCPLRLCGALPHNCVSPVNKSARGTAHPGPGRASPGEGSRPTPVYHGKEPRQWTVSQNFSTF